MEGLDLSGGGLFADLLVGTIGTGLLMYGRKAMRAPQILTGIAMMCYPFVVQGAAPTLSIGALLVAAMCFFVRLGY